MVVLQLHHSYIYILQHYNSILSRNGSTYVTYVFSFAEKHLYFVCMNFICTKFVWTPKKYCLCNVQCVISINTRFVTWFFPDADRSMVSTAEFTSSFFREIGQNIHFYDTTSLIMGLFNNDKNLFKKLRLLIKLCSLSKTAHSSYTLSPIEGTSCWILVLLSRYNCYQGRTRHPKYLSEVINEFLLSKVHLTLRLV